MNAVITTPVCIMSFNILTDNFFYRVRDCAAGRCNRLQQLATILLACGCDVIGLQECTLDQWNFLAKVLAPVYATHAGASDSKASGETCALFWNTARFPGAVANTFWINNTLTPYQKMRNAKRMRVCSWVRLTDALNLNRVITVFNTHFDHAGDTAGNTVRVTSAGIVLGQIKALGSGHDILMGDLNFHPQDPPYQAITPALSDCGALYKASTGAWPVTYHGWGSSKAGCIDYIFCSPNWQVLSYKLGGIASTVPKTYPSDHFPVIALLA